MKFQLKSDAQELLRRIKSDHPILPHEWSAIQDPDQRAYLVAERAIVQERYLEINDELVATCSEPVRQMILTYRDLFLSPHVACRRAGEILNRYQDRLGSQWIARIHFWLADAHHLIGEITEGQAALSRSLFLLEDCQEFRAEALTVTALCEYLAGENDSAADYHYQARAELVQRPDLFLSIFNSSMALRVFLKKADPVGFEVFSAELDSALSKKEDRRYLLRQTGYRAMLMTVVGDHEEARRLWERADLLAEDTTLAWERGQFWILRGLASALFDGTAASAAFFARAQADLALAGSPGPYQAELDCARVFAHWVSGSGQNVGQGLRGLLQRLEQGRERLAQQRASAPAGLQSYYEHADQALGYLLSGSPSGPPTGPSLVVSLMTRLVRTGDMTRSLSDFRLLPRFVRQLRRNSGSREAIASALQATVGLPVKLAPESNELGARTAAKIEAKIDAHDSRPDIKLVLELAETLIRHHDIVTSAERSRAVGELATQLAHDIRSPLAALKAANHSLGRERPDEAELIQAASARIQEIADDLLCAHRSGERPGIAEGSEVWSFGDEVEKLLMQKRAEYGAMTGLVLTVDFESGSRELKTRVNRAHFGRALSNIINNSVESLEGVGHVSCKVGLSEKSELEVVVSDTGPGFSPEWVPDSEGACVPSVPGAGLRSSKPSGLGLGLKHAREFAQGSGGRLVLGNLPDGRGARVGLVVPAWCPPPFA